LAKEAFLRSVLFRLAPVRSAPAKFVPINRLRCSTALARFAADRSTPARSRRFNWAFSSEHLAQDLLCPARKRASPSAQAAVATAPSPQANASGSANPRAGEMEPMNPNMVAYFRPVAEYHAMFPRAAKARLSAAHCVR